MSNDLAKDFKLMNELRKKRHNDWYHKNLQIIQASDLEYEATSDTCLIFRMKGYPKADFYPHTGRWRSNNKTYNGGATAFIKWLRNNKEL